MKLKGKVAIITGGATGIGGAIATRFSTEGAFVVICDIDLLKGKCKAEELNSIGGTAISVRCDVSNHAEVQEMLRTTVESFGKVDLLVNNAATTKRAPFVETTLDDWRSNLDVNLTGYFICAKAAAEEMIGNGAGRIINIASIASYVGIKGASAYAASKGGIIAWTRVLAIELAHYNITANCIAPGFIMTQAARKLLSVSDIKTRQERIPLGRYGRPEDVTGAAVFLASSDSEYITGTTLLVDGGFICSGLI